MSEAAVIDSRRVVISAPKVSAAAPPVPDMRTRALGGACVAALVLLGHLVVLAHNRRFYFQDDAQSYYLPMWQDLGRRLRSGEFPVLAPGQWMAGNFPVESQVGLWNPVQVAISALAPSIPRLAVLAALVAVSFAVLLGLGVYRAALAHGAAVRWAAVAGAAAPFAGWTLWYDTASWTIALMCSAFLAHAWPSLVRYARAAAGPLPAFAWLYLGLSMGYPYGAAAAGVLTLGVLVGVLVNGLGRGAAIRTASVGMAAVAATAITFLPGHLSYDVTFRVNFEQTFFNDGFLVLPWSETLGAGIPTYIPQMNGFAGFEQVPSTYIAWFLLPALPFLRWSSVRAAGRRLTGPLAVAGLMLLLTSAPVYLGPLRWPARFTVYIAMALLVALAVAATAGLATDRWRARAALAAAAVEVSAVRAASITAPDLGWAHLQAVLLVSMLGCLVGLAWWRRGPSATAAVLGVSVLPVLWLQISLFPTNPNWEEWSTPSDLAAARAVFPERPGSTLQLGSRDLIPAEDRTLQGAWSTLSRGSYARGLGRDYVNAYTPVGFERLRQLLCIDQLGDTCPEARARLFAPERSTGLAPADLMALDRVVLQRAQYPDAHVEAPPLGWVVADVDQYAVVLERTSGQGPGPGGVTWTRGVDVERVIEQSGRGLTADVTSSRGGRVVLSRLAWPGYRATLDGRPVEVTDVAGVFLAVDLPPGGTGVLAVGYEPPGWRLGGMLAVGGVAGVLLLALDHRRRRSTA